MKEEHTHCSTTKIIHYHNDQQRANLNQQTSMLSYYIFYYFSYFTLSTRLSVVERTLHLGENK